MEASEIANKVNQAVTAAMMETDAIVGRILVKQYKEICTKAIQEFYDGYDRQFYTPHNNLFNCFKVFQNETGVYLDIDSNYMNEIYERGMTAEKIYSLTMHEGYHGGSYGTTPDHRVPPFTPSGDVPYWRTPYPTYRFWGRIAAKQKVAPIQVIKNRAIKIDGYDLYMKTYSRIIPKYLKKYGLV